MRKQTPVCAMAFAWLAMSAAAYSAPAAGFAEISTALATGNGVEVMALTDAALARPDVSGADRARLLLDRGLAQQLQGDPQGALTDLTQAIDIRGLTAPEQAHAFLERGLVLDGMARLDDAIGDYGAVLRLTPNSPTALNNRANALRRQNHFEDARRDYLASLAADNPAPEYPYYGLGQIAESEGKPAEAKSFYARAVAANPDYSLAADRLVALGGAMAPAQAITLRPPTRVSAAPLMLHPLAAKAQPPATIKPVGYSARYGQPGLRPALDNPGAQQVQLGAWRQEAEVAEGWNRAVKDADGVLSGITPHIAAVDLPGRGRYYRLRVETRDSKQLCAVLVAKGMDCIPVHD